MFLPVPRNQAEMTFISVPGTTLLKWLKQLNRFVPKSRFKITAYLKRISLVQGNRKKTLPFYQYQRYYILPKILHRSINQKDNRFHNGLFLQLLFITKFRLKTHVGNLKIFLLQLQERCQCQLPGIHRDPKMDWNSCQHQVVSAGQKREEICKNNKCDRKQNG